MTAYHVLLAVHLVLAVFAIGPLVHAASTASRGIRTGDGAATASASRVLRIYGYVSALVIVAGLALMSLDSPYRPNEKVGEIGQTWIWLSIVLWAIGVGLVLGVIVPTLDRATTSIASAQSVDTRTARVAAAGGVVGLIFAVVVVLMVYRPGQ